MTTIETIIEVDDQRKATIQLPSDLAPGPYRAVVVPLSVPIPDR